MILPLVSCLCVSLLRPELERAIACFRAQSYPNRELVVVHEKPYDPLRRLLQARDIREIVVEGGAKLLLGQLRNVAIASSIGEYLCNWDDDDWSASLRVETQLATAQRELRRACALERWTVYDAESGRVAISRRRIWEGSLLWHRTLTGMGYPPLATGEDTPFAKRIHPVLLDRPDLYVYCKTGRNTLAPSHFDRMLDTGEQLDPTAAAAIAQLVGGSIGPWNDRRFGRSSSRPGT